MKMQKKTYQELIDILAKNPNDKTRIAHTYLKLSMSLRNLGNEKKALHYAKKALLISNNLKDNELLIFSNNVIGTILSKMGKYKEAISYYKQSLYILKKTNIYSFIL